MKTYIITDPGESTGQVEFKTDGIGNADNITIMSVTGLDVDDILWSQQEKAALLLILQKKETTLTEIVEFCEEQELNLVEISGNTSTTLVEWGSDTDSGSWEGNWD